MQRQSVRNLPTNKSPTGTRCIQITIPDDDEWERDLFGEVWRLTRWMLWERDITKSGKPVADIWLQAIDTWTHCDDTPVPPLPGIEEDFDMPFRVDCECNVFYTCPDGTEKQIFNSQQVMDALQQQGGQDTPQPEPGGGCQSYHGTMLGNGSWPVSPPLSTGDTVEITGFSGATNESGFPLWYGPDGRNWFAGKYDGPPLSPVGTDPVPTAPHQSLILSLAGNFYSIIPGVFTVPMGITKAQGTILLNTDNASALSGTVQFDVKVCNNEAAKWTSTLDFTLASYFSLLSSIFGNYVAGVGWTGVPNGTSPSYVQFNLNIGACDITSLLFNYSLTSVGGSGAGLLWQVDGSTVATGAPTAGTNETFLHMGNHAVTTYVLPVIADGPGGGDAVLTRIVITGTGTKPAVLP